MKNTLLYGIALLMGAMSYAQVTFTNQGGLLGNYPDNSETAVDMNGDWMDDYVRVSANGVGIDYQVGDGTFNSVFYPISIQNVPDWSVAAGDIDGNGYNDLVLGNGSRVSFLYANANGTAYTETTFPEFIFSQRSTFQDIDNDGDLDSFVCHDIDLSHPYRNDGSGNLTLDQTLIETLDRPGNYAAIWVDYDNDGDSDMYLTKCRGGAAPGNPNRDNAMYTNNGDGTFTENALDIGMRDNAQSWSTVFEDFDNDGDYDAFIVNHDFQNRFMLNDGTGNFTDIIGTTGIDAGDLGAWENQAGDFNNDGFVDIFSELSKELYINNGDLTFTGIDLPFDEGGIGDFNGDGFLDVVNNGDLWLNDANSGNNWVKIGLQGVQSNLNGIGARIELYGSWGKQIREVRSGQGFSHMNSLVAHFGIGTATEIDQMIIKWPSGIVDVIDDPAFNTQHIIVEGQTLGLEEFLGNEINIYPNPTTDLINFSLNGLESTAVTVVDVTGKIVLNTVISSENNIDVSSLKSGVYFAKIEVEGRQASYKFIKN